MNNVISRRAMLVASGSLGAAGLLRGVPSLAQTAPATQAGLPPVCLSMYYLSNGGAKFDRMKFRDKGVPHLRSIYGDSLERIELRTAPRPRRNDAGPSTEYGVVVPPVLAIASLWVKSLDAYAAATLKAGDKLADGLKGISNGQVALQWEQLIAARGEPRESVAQGSDCFVTLYPAKDAGKWDAAYYTDTYLPKVMEAYGPDALRRVEVCKGVSLQGGGKAVFTSAVNMYIKDQQLFDSKSMQAGMGLMAEGAKFTDIMPVVGTFDVYAVG